MKKLVLLGLAVMLLSSCERHSGTISRLRMEEMRRNQELSRGQDAGAGCFAPDTKVLMADQSYKSIKNLKVGDTVKGLDFGNQEVDSVKITKTFQFTQHHFYLINGSLRVTGTHPFLTPEGWKRAAKLALGDKINTGDGFVKVTSIEFRKLPEGVLVYNLDVDGDSNFLVFDGKTHYVVHNTGGGK